MLRQNIFSFVCKNCSSHLCDTDGTYLFVENLEVLPKVETIKRKNSAQIVKNIICAECKIPNKIFLKKPAAEPQKPASGKFSIFRSRF